MEISESNLLVEAAESGNFAAFCVFSLLEGVNLQKISDFQTLYEKIRENLPECEETQDSWFSLSEFFDFCSKQNNTVPLFEIASMTTRLKLRRAAKRTSKVRARKRKMRERLRKNKTQLKKRAYNQVKTELRKRLTGGKSWSSLSLSTRARIDSIISKRKPMLNRMVKQRTQKMPAQESQRLRKLSMRESISYFCKYLMEEQTRQEKRLAGKVRKQRFDQRNEQDPARFFKRVRVVKDPDGDTKLIEVDSEKKGYHTGAKGLKSAQEAEKLCSQAAKGEIEFDQTDTSKKLCGDIEKVKPKSQSSKKSKNSDEGEASMSISRISDMEPSYIELPELRNSSLSANNSESSFQVVQSIFAQYEGDPEKFQKLLQSYEIASRVESALQSGEDIKSQIDPDQLRQHKEVINTLKKAGMEKSDIKNLLGSGTGLRRMITQYESLQNMQIGTGLGSDYVVLSSGKVKQKIAAGWSGTDRTSKSDVVMIHKKHLTGKTQQEQIQSAKSILQQISEGKMSTEGMDIVGGSIKSGAARILSALPSGEGSALIRNVITLAQKENPDFIKTEQFKRLTGLLDLITTYKEAERIIIHDTLTNIRRLEISTQEIQEWQQAKKTIDSALSDIFNNDPELRAKLLYSAMTGDGKFEPGSPGIATDLITANTENNSITSVKITMDLAREMSKNFKIRIGTKSSSQSGDLADENKKRLAAWKKGNKNISALETAKALIDNEKLLEESGIPKDVDISKINLSAEQFKNISSTQRSLMEANVRANTRSVWSIFEAVKQKSKRKRIKEAFSYNSLLRYLIETNNSKELTLEELTPEEEQEIDEIMDNIQPDLVEYAKTNFNFMLKMLGVEIDSVYIEDPIDLQDYMRKPKTSRANSIYINGELNLVPVDERDDIQEQRVEFALNFLNENKKRNYRGEYDNYHSKPDQRKNRSKRNMARRWAERKGLVRKGDGKDVDHKNGDPRDNSPENLRVRSRSTNRADND